jgi:type IV fimbrial biogenesis protein FimT
MHPNSARGFNLFELLMAMAVFGILAGLAAPGFNDVILDSRRTAAVNGFVHTVFLARSAAVMSGHIVTLCGSNDGRTCRQSSEWATGWIVFANSDRDEPPVRDDDEAVLAVQPPWPSGTITSNRNSYSFRPHRQGVVNGTIVFCDRRGPAHARAIIISQTGRPRVSNSDTSGKPLRCPPASP